MFISVPILLMKKMERERVQSKLYEAAKFGDFDCLTQMSGYLDIDFNQTTPMGNNLLHVATQHKQVDFIEQLLAQCPSSGHSLLFQGNRKGDTPLHIAAKVGSHNIIKIFIDFAKALVFDLEGGQIDRREELLRMANVDKDTSLHYAARYDHSEVVKLLIEEDLELCNIANDAHESPLYLATARGHFDTAVMILDTSPPQSSHKGCRGMTALHAALDHKAHHKFVETIVERRPQMIRERDDTGWTPFHYAARYDKIEAVQLFLKHDISATYLLDNDGDSALHIAAFSGHIDVIKELIKSSPDACELINNKGQTALHIAVIGGRLDVVKFILRMPSFEFLINEQDEDGNTALHLAALHQQYNIIYFLARNQKVHPWLLNKEHLTALAIFNRHGKVGYKAAKVHYLLKATSGVQFMQDSAIKGETKWLESKSTELQSVTSSKSTELQSVTSTATMNDNESNHRKIDWSQHTTREVYLIVTVLIATVTFAAAFTLPGGFKSDGPNQGMATLAGKAAFKAFVVFNTMAFASSALAMFLQFDTSFVANDVRARYASVAHGSIFVAMIGMVLSFACGTYVVLMPETPGLVVFLCALGGCLIIIYSISMMLDPAISPEVLGRYIRKFVFAYGIL